MRTRRAKHESTPLSMFSFQDIILTTIGVVLLIMLILALQIAFTVTAAVLPDAQAETTPAADPAEQRREIEARKELFSFLQNDPESAADRMRSTSVTLAEQIENSRHELFDRRSDILAGNPALQEEIFAVHEKIADATSTAAELRADLKQTIANSVPVAELFELMDARAQLEAEMEGLIANDSLVYIRQEDPDNTPVLIEFRPEQTIVHGTGTDMVRPEIWIDFPDVDMRCEATVQAIQQLVSGRFYPLLLVQPGSGETAACVREKLKKLGIAAGFDLLDPGRTTVPEGLPGGGLEP